MKQSDSKQLFFTVWAANADPNTLRNIPQKASEATEAGAASLEKGFTATNMTPVAAGGVPPFGQDFNGILNYLSRAAQLIEMGLVPGWSKSFSDAIGGYPQNAKIAYTKGGIPDIFVSIQDDNLDDPSDPNQTSWVSIKKGLQPAGNYAYTNAIDAPPDENGNVGLSWIGLSKNDATARILATDKEGDIVTAANLSDLNGYQPKGAYPITNADITKPDENNNIGISWIGGWIDDKNVTRVRATDGIAGVVATCANLDDLDNYQLKGDYVKTNESLTEPDESGNFGVGWIGLNKNSSGAHLLAKDNAGDLIEAANLSDLNGYQPKGFYTPTFDPSAKRNENKQVGIANFCSWNGSSDGKDRLQVTLGSGGNELTYVSARTDDLDAYQPKGYYVPTQSTDSIDGNKNTGISWSGLYSGENDGKWRLSVSGASSTGNVNIIVPLMSEIQDRINEGLSNYQPKNNYIFTNNTAQGADDNGNIGIEWAGINTNKDNFQIIVGTYKNGSLAYTAFPSFQDLSAYLKLGDGSTNKSIQSGTVDYTQGTDGPQWIPFPTQFSNIPDVMVSLIDTSDASRDTSRIYGITKSGFYVAADGAPQSISWMAIGNI